MNSKAMSLKAKIRNYAVENKIAAQTVLQNYMFERFLDRLSHSIHKDSFIIKGGMLIAALVGLDTRSTMDLDTTLQGLPLTEKSILMAIEDITRIDLDDGVLFSIVSIAPIRRDDIYGGFCLRVNAVYDTIVTPLSIDVSTGDIITPNAIAYAFSGLLDENIQIHVWGYNIETVMAEKIETILSRGTLNTRPRDYYDVYILHKSKPYDKSVFEKALIATSTHRGSSESITDRAGILARISVSSDLQNMWSKYRQKYPYAREISYDEVMAVLRELLL